jgi:preprotein translocase subunit SecF
MNQVLARSLNTSLVAILPILSILVIGAWVLGATALEDFGLALFIGLTTGAYSSIFIASPLLAVMKEREPRYAEIRRRLAQSRPRRLTPAAAIAEAGLTDAAYEAGARGSGATSTRSVDPAALPSEREYGVGPGEPASGEGAHGTERGPAGGSIPLRRNVPPRSGNRPPPRPRKKGRRR